MNEEMMVSALKITDEPIPNCENTINTLEVKPFRSFLIDKIPPTTPLMLSIESQTEKNEKITQNKPLTFVKKRKFSKRLVFQKNEDSANFTDNRSPLSERRKRNSRFFSLMIKYFYVKKFVFKMREMANFRNSNGLKAIHYGLLNDFLDSPIKKFDQKLKKLLKSQFCRVFVLLQNFLKTCGKVQYPTNNFRLFFDLIQILLNLFYLGFIPIGIGFNIEILHEMGFAKYLSFFLFFLDFLVNFRTAFYHKGELITSKSLIIKHYTHGFFIYDIVSLFFFLLNGLLNFSCGGYLVKISGFLFIFRIRNLSQAISKFEDFMFTDEKIDNMIGFCKLIFMVLLFSHWSACVWILIGRSEGKINWISKNGIGADFIDQYVNALYYVVVVINTVGFGDIVSTTKVEKVFTIVFIFIACVIFGYTLNRIGMILQNINRNEREFKRNLNLINGFMKSKNIAFELKIKIKHYLEYLWQEDRHQNNRETQEIINRLSKTLKEELLLNANGTIIKEIPLFNNNFSEATLRKIVWEMKEINLTPGDIIYNEQEIDDKLYILRDGEAELFLEGSTNRKKISIKILKKGDCFGEISFFSGMWHQTSARSLSFSSLFVIRKDDFLSILKQNLSDFERFCQIKDQINLSHDISRLFLKCDSCGSSCHTLNTCPKIHLIPHRENIIQKYQKSPPQERKLFLRNANKKKIIFCSDFHIFQTKAKEFFEEHDNFFDTFEDYDPSSLEREKDPSKQISKFSFEYIPECRSSKEKNEENNNNNNSKEFIETRKKKDSLNSSINEKDRKKKNVFFEDEKEVKKDFCTQISVESINQRIENMTIIDKMTVDLDVAQEYAVYYPELNYGEVMEKINRTSARKRKKMKSMFNLMTLTFSQKKIKSLKSPTNKRKQMEILSNNRFFGKDEITLKANSVKNSPKKDTAKRRKKSFNTDKITGFMRIVKWALRYFKK